MHRFHLLSVLALASLAAVGCAAQTGNEGESASSENTVRTARCADSIAMHVSSLEMRTFFAELQAPSDYNAMKSVAYEIGTRQTTSSPSLGR